MVGTHVLLASLSVCGGIMELLARLLTVGTTNVANWLAKDFNLNNWTSDNDGTGWRVLEMIHMITNGMTLWVDAFETLAFFGITSVFFYSVAKEPKYRVKSSAMLEETIVGIELEGSDNSVSSAKPCSSPQPPAAAFAAVSLKVPCKPSFNKCFIYYGLVIGVFSLLDFIADVLRFVNWKVFGSLSMAMNILVGVFLLPIWLLCLARQLPLVTERFERSQRWAEIRSEGDDGERTSLVIKGGDVELS